MAGNLPLLPDQFFFSTEIPVRITDLNYGNHVGNDTVLSLLHEARIRYLADLGFSELSFAGCGLIMKDAVIEFKKEMHYGHTLVAEVIATGFTRISFDLYYRLRIRETDTIAVLARTGMVCFDYSAKKVTAVPAAALEVFAGKDKS